MAKFLSTDLKKGVSESLSVPSVAEITWRTISITLSTNSCLALEAALFSPTRLVAVTQLMAPSLKSWPCSIGTCLCQILPWNLSGAISTGSAALGSC